jgi:hypothetical protein
MSMDVAMDGSRIPNILLTIILANQNNKHGAKPILPPAPRGVLMAGRSRRHWDLDDRPRVARSGRRETKRAHPTSHRQLANNRSEHPAQILRRASKSPSSRHGRKGSTTTATKLPTRHRQPQLPSPTPRGEGG